MQGAKSGWVRVRVELFPDQNGVRGMDGMTVQVTLDVFIGSLKTTTIGRVTSTSTSPSEGSVLTMYGATPTQTVVNSKE